MRFIIHELPYEKPVVAGRLRYERDGRPTGAVEAWRLTDAVDGFRFLRVDLDARAAASGRSTLFHVTLNTDGRPEAMKFRFWGDGLTISGAIVWEDAELLATREVNGERHEDTARGKAFWFPSGLGLTLLRQLVGEHKGVTLLTDTSRPDRAMALVETPVSVAWNDGIDRKEPDGPAIGRALHVNWPDNRRIVWLDVDGTPVRLWRDDGLTAVAERVVHYGK